MRELTFADLVTGFFSAHLVAESGASSHTVQSYRDTFKILLRYAAATTGLPPVRMSISTFTPEVVTSFLRHLESDRGNCIATRNSRLAAIRSFFAYASTRDPAVLGQSRQILAIPFKRGPHRLLGHLADEELQAILGAPDRTREVGRRDYLALALLYDTGARASELVAIRPCDFRFERYSVVTLTGKGKKSRTVPLLPATAELVLRHLDEHGLKADDEASLLRSSRGPLTRSGVAFLVRKYRLRAADAVPSLRRNGISPHTFRHTKAMSLLRAGIHPVTIKDFLGHADLSTLAVYVQADVEMKRAALEVAGSPVDDASAVRNDPDLLAYLESL